MNTILKTIALGAYAIFGIYTLVRVLRLLEEAPGADALLMIDVGVHFAIGVYAVVSFLWKVKP